MAYTTIDKPDDYFNTVLYTGTGATQSITGVGFQPDFTWCKARNSGTPWHQLTDSVRGTNSQLFSNSTSAEETATTKLTSFDSDGFTLGSSGGINGISTTYVGWSWLAGGTGVSNTDGTITSTVSANTTSGFSIVSWSGNSTAGATIGHGLGVAPKMIIVKDRDGADSWVVYHNSLAITEYLILNGTLAALTDNEVIFYDTDPTSSVFTVGAHNTVNQSGHNYIAYCFAEKKGFSKAFSYTGNGSADGVFTYCGFKPAFLLVKSTGADNWCMLDNKRDTFNVMDKRLFPHLSNAESTGVPTVVDFVSNGFKLRTSDSSFNLNGQSFIGFAIAEHPFTTSTGIPTTAR
jgi:hypothetical protein